jgi:hypothetical protein
MNNGPELIRKYIKHKTGIDIGGIQEPQTPYQWDLYNQAVIRAAIWWMQEGGKDLEANA